MSSRTKPACEVTQFRLCLATVPAGLSASTIMTLLVVEELLYKKIWQPLRDCCRPTLNAASVSL